MKLSLYQLNRLELETLATAEETTLGQVLKRIIGIEQGLWRDSYRKTAKVNCEDMKQDIRWKMGSCEEGIAFPLDLFAEADKELARVRTKEKTA